VQELEPPHCDAGTHTLRPCSEIEVVMNARLLVVMGAQTLWSAAQAEVPAYDVSGRFAGTYLCGATAAADVTWDAVKGQWRGDIVAVRHGSLSLEVSSPEYRSWKAFGIELSAAFYTVRVARLPMAKRIHALAAGMSISGGYDPARQCFSLAQRPSMVRLTRRFFSLLFRPERAQICRDASGKCRVR
jgi:hypothetical protein